MTLVPTPGAGAALDTLLLFRLSRLLAVGGAPVIRLCEGRYGITRREWRVLATLAEHGTLGSSALAEVAHLDRARTSRAVGSLAAKGLITRSAGEGDRRQVRLAITERGRAVYDELFPQVHAINAELMAALAPQEAAAFDQALARLDARALELLAGAREHLPKADRGRHGRHAGAPAPAR